jgi:O-antigen/teichoic acid export membrane protein
MTAPSLKDKVLSGSIWSLVGASGHQAFGLFVFIFLSRILEPEDFGMLAMAQASIGIIGLISTLGLERILVKEKEATPLILSTIFWLTSFASVISSLALYALAQPISHLMDIPVLVPIIRAVSVVPIITTLAIIPYALQEREHNFKPLALCNLFSATLGGIIAIILALLGFSVFSIVFQFILVAALKTLFTWYGVQWRPECVFSKTEAQRLLGQSVPLILSTFTFRIGYSSRDFIIGYFLGATALGYLRITARLHDFVVQLSVLPLFNIALTTFSKLQDDKEKVAKAYRRITQVSCLITFPSFIGLAVIAPEFITLMFGEKWLPSAYLMQILCIGSLSSTINYFMAPLLISLNQTKLIAKFAVFEALLLISITVVTSQFNVSAVMIGFVIWNTLLTVVYLVILRKLLEIPFKAVIEDYLPPACAATVMAVLLIVFKPYVVAELPAIWMVIATIMAGGILYPLVLFLLFPKYTRETINAVLPTLLRKFKKQDTTEGN